MRIGILGGSFNPVHLGHLLLADGAMESFALDQVWFVPCCRPPHKATEDLAAAHHRLCMLRAAIRGDRRFRVSEVDLRRGGVSYAVDTVAALQMAHPDHQWMFLIGMDGLKELHLWHDAQRLVQLCPFGIFERPGSSVPPERELSAFAPRTASALLRHVDRGRFLDVSSREIRDRIAAGKEIRYIVPEAVRRYIRAQGLYGG